MSDIGLCTSEVHTGAKNTTIKVKLLYYNELLRYVQFIVLEGKPSPADRWRYAQKVSEVDEFY